MLIQSLINEGVEFIFGYPGGAALIFMMLYLINLKFSIFLSDMSKLQHHAADGYTRTGKVGVVLVTSGPGLPMLLQVLLLHSWTQFQ